MPLYAIDDIDDALDATRSFLAPVSLREWLKLALVALFVGGPSAGLNGGGFNAPAGGGTPPTGDVPMPDVGPQVIAVIAAVVTAVLVVGLLFVLVGSIMEFVFVESLRNEEVAVRRYWGRRWRQGLRLFGFRVVLGVLGLGGALVVGGAVFLPALLGRGEVSIAAFLVLLPVFVVGGAVFGLINGFATVFVVPIMVLYDCGVLAGWRRLWPTLTARWKQYLAYAVGGFVLSVAGGIVVAIATLVAVVVLLIPFGILGAVGFALLSAVPSAGIAVLSVVGVAFAVVALSVVALAQVPVLAYLRYYALFVLGDIDDSLDLIPDRRAAVRAGEQ